MLARPSPPHLPPPVPPVTLDGREARSLFGGAPGVRHLNHGSFGSPVRAATLEQERLRARMLDSPVGWFPAVPASVAVARAEVAPFLGVPPDGLAFVPNASGGATVVFTSLGLPRGAEILVTDHGYGAVVMGAERLARRVGGRVVVAHVPLDADPQAAVEAVRQEFTERTALLVIDQVTSPTARGLPVGTLNRLARERGIVSVVDGAHATMMIPGAVADADADYWFGNLHKFACAPQGSAVIVPRPGLGEALFPLIDSWGARLGFPQRFDHQGTLDVTPWLASPTALTRIEEQVGWSAVVRYATDLADHAERLIGAAMSEAVGVECGVDVAMPAAAMRLVALPPGLAAGPDQANTLRDRVLADLGIEAAFTSFHGRGYLRLSAHLHNTGDDYADFADRAVPYLVRLARTEQADVTGAAGPSALSSGEAQ